MHIKNEIVKFLEKNLSSKTLASRNIDIVLYHYGFTGEVAPTLESTAEHFNIGTRERVRQILSQSLLNKAKLTDFPFLVKCNELIETKKIWLYGELDFIIKTNFSNIRTKRCDTEEQSYGTSFQNLISLIQDLGGLKNYDFYDHKFAKMTRPAVSRADNCFLMDISKEEVKEYQQVMRKTRTLPGVLGVAAIDYMDSFPISKENYKEAILIDETTWIHHENDTMYFTYEERDNFLINSAEKVFSVFESVNVKRLASSMHNGLTRRGTKYAYPHTDLIELYLRESRHFEISGDQIKFLGEKGGLTDIENDTVEFLKTVKETPYRPLRDHLMAKGYTSMHTFHANYSPLVYVSRDNAEQKMYSLVGIT